MRLFHSRRLGPGLRRIILAPGGLIILETSCGDSKPFTEGLAPRYSPLRIIPCFLFFQALIKLDSA